MTKNSPHEHGAAVKYKGNNKNIESSNLYGILKGIIIVKFYSVIC